MHCLLLLLLDLVLSNMTIRKTWMGCLGFILSIGHALSFVAATGSSAMDGWPPPLTLLLLN